jgi:hypothetical protein
MSGKRNERPHKAVSPNQSMGLLSLFSSRKGNDPAPTRVQALPRRAVWPMTMPTIRSTPNFRRSSARAAA